MIFKKSLIVLICCALIICSIPFESNAASTNDALPYVLVSGMDVLPLYKTSESGKVKKVYPLTAGNALRLAADALPALVRFVFDKDYEKLADKLFPATAKAFEALKCDDNGKPLYDVTSQSYPLSVKNYPELYKNEKRDELGIIKAAVEKFGADKVYFYNYDWRLSPLDHVQGLRKLIETALRDHSCEKIDLACCSMGGNIVMSYLDEYGAEELRSVSLLSTAFQGVDAVGAMLNGEICFKKDAVLRRLNDLGKTDLTASLYRFLTGFADKTGIADKLIGFADTLIAKNRDKLYDELLTPVFGSMPGIWALLNADDYTKAKNYMLDGKDSVLSDKTEHYLNNIQINAKRILDSAKGDGANLYIVCQYNYQSLPVSLNTDINNDLMVDVKYASGGAVCADLGKTLPEGYKQTIQDGHDHISADRVIDASVCMFPEYTWFIKNQAHVDYPAGVSTDFLFTLSGSENQPDVFSFKEYPQFTEYDYDTDTLTSLTHH